MLPTHLAMNARQEPARLADNDCGARRLKPPSPAKVVTAPSIRPVVCSASRGRESPHSCGAAPVLHRLSRDESDVSLPAGARESSAIRSQLSWVIPARVAAAREESPDRAAACDVNLAHGRLGIPRLWLGMTVGGSAEARILLHRAHITHAPSPHSSFRPKGEIPRRSCSRPRVTH
jgi:hypothetical protein